MKTFRKNYPLDPLDPNHRHPPIHRRQENMGCCCQMKRAVKRETSLSIGVVGGPEVLAPKWRLTLKGLRALPTLVQQFLSAISRCRPRRRRTCSLPSSVCRLRLSLEERGRPSLHWPRRRRRKTYTITHTVIHTHIKTTGQVLIGHCAGENVTRNASRKDERRGGCLSPVWV